MQLTFIAVAKGAVEGLTRTLAAEWAPKTRVNCLAPALTDTPLTANFFQRKRSERQNTLLAELGVRQTWQIWRPPFLFRKVGGSRDK